MLSLAVLLGVAAVWFIPRGDEQHGAQEVVTPTPPDESLHGANAPSTRAGESVVKRGPVVADEILAVWKALTLDPASAQAALDALAIRLDALTAGEAAAAIRGFLDGHQDVATKLPFAIGDGGNLATAPTFRVWLLDQLGQRNPEAAANYAQSILATHESADEWALALRNYERVRAAPADAVFLKEKAKELLGDPRWQREQSVGWLEAFDIVVHTRATELTPELAQLLVRTEDTSRPAAHAAFLTLDRLILAQPAEMLETLVATPTLMKGRELTRANYFARADVRDVRQRAAVERYLLDPTRPAEELSKFAGLYPNANMMISKNLVTPSESFSRDDLLARDREALRVVEEWIGDPRFERVQPNLQTMRGRLAEFVKSVEK